MCKTKQGTRKSNPISFPLGLAAVAALLLGSSQVMAHQSPAGCNANNLIINISKDHNNVTNGTVVTFGVTVENPAAGGSCDITLGAAGLVFTCPGADGSASGTQTVLIPGGTVIPAGTPQASFTIPCTINVTTAATAAQAKVDAPGAVLHDNTIQDDPANINKTISVNVFRPCIDVTKECDGAPFAIGTPIKIKGVVTNCGDVLLQNVTVVDDHAGTLLGPITLAPGASAPYTGQYTPTGNPCGPFTDTVTATGVAPLDTPVTVTDTASATCPVITAPCIDVTKTCPASVTLGSPVTFSGSVSNCGNVLLTNVIVRDSVLGMVFGPVDLAPHTAQTFSGSHPVTVCGPFTDTVTASGADACTGATVMDTASCTTTVLCPPHINVDKQVACVPSGGNCEGAGVIYGETATGVTGAGFCYKITVVNDGADVLNNVTVSDPDLPGVAGAFPSTFAIGQSETRFFKKTWPAGTHVNTVTANGVGASTGITTNDTDTATAVVVPISVACSITLFSQFDGDGNPNDNHVTLLGSGPVDFSLRINNTGQADLSVAIVGRPCSVDLGGNPIPNTLTIPAGGSTNFVCRVEVVCPQGTNFTVTVTGTAVASATVPCVFDENGNAVTTAPSSCTASVNASCPPHINVDKQVACVPSGGDCEGAGVTYGEIATGVAGAGFCYKITVVNDGADVLNSVTVSDPDIPGVAGAFPTTFAIGQSETRFFKKTWPVGTHVNTVIANGVGASSGISTNATDTATAIVVPISVACIAVAGPTPLPASGPVTFQLTINNTGQADLSVAITHNVPCTLPSPVFVAAGGSTNLSCTAQVNCPDGANFSVTVVGTAVASTAVPCVFDSQGQAVTTGPSVCTATVECQAKAGCTPGFWKNCTIHWQPTGYRTDQAVGTVFELGSCCNGLGNTKLLAALDFGGGSDVCGGAQNLLRAAVAALLNAASPEVDYPFTAEEVIASVNAALKSCDRATMINLASELDRNNNLGCKDANGNELPCKRLTE